MKYILYSYYITLNYIMFSMFKCSVENFRNRTNHEQVHKYGLSVSLIIVCYKYIRFQTFTAAKHLI